MSEDKKKSESEDLSRAIRLRQERKERWDREGERPLWKNISMIGSLGWLVVVPILIGTFVGRMLDQMTGQDVFWTGALIVLGVFVGSYLGWQKVTKE